MPAKKPVTKRMFGRKPEKNMRRLDAFIRKGKVLGYLGDRSAIRQEADLRKTLLKMNPKERADFIKYNNLRIGGVDEKGKVIYGTGDEALRVTRGLIKRHLRREPNAIQNRIATEIEELAEKGTQRRLTSDEQVRLRELITAQSEINAKKSKK